MDNNCWREWLETAVLQFQGRVITDDVFRGCLYSAGFRGARLDEEFNYQCGIRHDIDKLRSLDGRVVIT